MAARKRGDFIVGERAAEDAQLERKREHYFNTFNAKNGKLVRGANWFDERYGNAGTKNPAGMNAKVRSVSARKRSRYGTL